MINLLEKNYIMNCKIKNFTNKKDLKLFWDTYQKNYTKYLEIETLPLSQMLYNLSHISILNANSKILELSIGGGKAFENLIKQTPCKIIFGGDLSENMLREANSYLELQLGSNFKNYKNKNINTLILDNEDLSQFDDNYFNTIISNLSIHLVSDPNKMLNEMHRVIDKNNKNSTITVSVWGRPQNNFIFSIIPKHMKLLNFEIPNIRSNYHLSKKSKIIDLVNEFNFNSKSTYKFNISYMEYISYPSGFCSSRDIIHILDSPIYKEIINIPNNKLKEREFINNIIEEADKQFSIYKRLSYEYLIIQLNISKELNIKYSI